MSGAIGEHPDPYNRLAYIGRQELEPRRCKSFNSDLENCRSVWGNAVVSVYGDYCTGML